MSVAVSVRYLGGKKMELLHEPSGAKMVTDAPRDNEGEGSSFSPTDMLAGSLAACMMTIMANVAARGGIDLNGMHARVEKHMHASPRRVAMLPVTIHLPGRLSAPERQKLENAAKTCPVHHSLGEQVERPVEFVYDL